MGFPKLLRWLESCVASFIGLDAVFFGGVQLCSAFPV